MADKKKCFVIMPISTHDSHLSDYRGDKDHFKHVLDHLFRPAITSIGYETIPPNAKGADLIHAEIIKNIEESDLVLCDMSTLNPNVFFELGIRTALNKPICMVKDNKTLEIPFDTGIIHTHTYLSCLDPWTLDSEVSQLQNHIKESIDSGTENRLWKYFGISNVAKEYKEKPGEDAKYNYLTFQLDAIRQDLENQKIERSNRKGILPNILYKHNINKQRLMFNLISEFLDSHGVKYDNLSYREPDIYTIIASNGIPDNNALHRLFDLEKDLDIHILVSEA